MATGGTFPTMDRLGCSSITFRFLPLDEALRSIHAAGLSKVDIACIPGFCDHYNPLETTPERERKLQEALRSLGLTVSTLNVSAGGLNTERREEVFRYVEAALGVAARLGCYAITIPTGSKPASPALWEKDVGLSCQMIRRLAGTASEREIALTLEAPHPKTLAEDVAEAQRFFRHLADARVACTFDTSHVARGNPVPVPRLMGEIGVPIGHVHLRDCIGENNHLTPGAGQIDFKGVIRELHGRGYPGDLIVELEGDDRLKAAGELASAVRFMKDLART